MKWLRDNSGVSLIELLISVAIISVALVPIIGFYNSSLRQTSIVNQQTRVKFLAEEEMEKFISVEYEDASLQCYSTREGNLSFFERNEFLVKTQVVFIDPMTMDLPDIYPNKKENDTNLKRITVSVSRKDGQGGQVNLVYFKSP
jgi:prepilin-type N-terminal cleavage/methylation domain-containing protein